MARLTFVGAAVLALSASDIGPGAAWAEGVPAPAAATVQPDRAEARATEVIDTWVRLTLELVRHTATASPPMASRAFGYIGVTAFEAQVGGPGGLRSLAGQLNGLTPPPARDPSLTYDEAMILQAALTVAVNGQFANTGPTGQRALVALAARLDARAEEGVAVDVAARSVAHGAAVARHILEWSRDDGGTPIANMGFPQTFDAPTQPGAWVPTSLVRQQQAPLLPDWGKNRTFAMPDGAACPLPDPIAYSEEPGSPFHAQAMEVVAVTAELTPDQRAIARFWADDPMLSPTPPGHWISIAMQVMRAEGAGPDRQAEVLARLGIALSDSFVACWHEKFEHNTLRPVSYIRRVMDPKWEPILITPPFPEYPSGHSTQSGAAAAVLTQMFGEGYAFTDATHEDDGLPARSFPNFRAAAEEAGMSRLYGGIHFREAIDRGLDQGDCVGAYANALVMR